MKIRDLTEGLIGIVLFAAMIMVAFWLGRLCGQSDALNEQTVKPDTVTVRDTVRVPTEVLEAQVVTQEVVRYKYVPLTLTDTVVKTDTVVRVEDGVAVIPISMKTYTDSATYKAVVSGYDPRLESIEVYQENTVITRTLESPRWSIDVQGGVYMTPAGVQPGIGVGIGYRLW